MVRAKRMTKNTAAPKDGTYSSKFPQASGGR